jgi:pyridinium-3,5-bisthiocarboxylic acid mononucleotide nickel chelatase
MRIAYLDCFSGISGDMFLGALVDAGVPFELLQQTVEALHVGAKLEVSQVDRNGISATKIDVVVDGRKDLPREEFWAAESEQHSHDHGEKHSHPHSRHLGEILKIIAAAPISDLAKQTASAIFTALGEAEAKVHNVPVEAVHFHEVGAADAIVDIVCAAVGAEALQTERILASPLNVGSGRVKCAHGVMPVPAPATLELLKGIPVYSGEVQKELVTPTGAAIIKVLAAQFGTRPTMLTERIGYGAGTRDFPQHSNVLRLTVGETAETSLGIVGPRVEPTEEEIVVVEANLDDLSPQIIGYIADQVLAEGALDVFTAAVQMKKGRPGTLLTILAKPQDEPKLRDLLFRESSTLGVRSRREQRHVLARRHEKVETQWGTVRIKIGSIGNTDSQFAPEYEDCRRIAAQEHVPLKQVMQEALRLYLDKKNE